jgi:peptide/nickel transport system permease protein
MTGPQSDQKPQATLGATPAADVFKAGPAPGRSRTGRVRTVLRRLGFRRPVSPVLIVVLVLLVVTLAPAVAGGDPLNQQLTEALQGPSSHFWLGTDEYGRDVLARVIAGTRTSLYTSLAVVAITLAVGIVVGSLAAVVAAPGGLAISGLINFALGVPGIVIAIAVVGALGPGTRNIVIAFTATGWSWYARLSEEQARQLLAGRVVAVAQVSGVPAWRCVTGHVIPHVFRRLLVVACLDVGWVVLAIAGLGYLGLGAQPPAPELGQMLLDGQNYVQDAPWMILAPAGALVLVVLPFVVAGERVHARVLRV